MRRSERQKLYDLRFRCQECGRLIPKGSHKCPKCGSYDIDIDV